MDSPKTGLELGATISVGNYNTIRATVWSEMLVNGDIPTAQDVLYAELIQQLNDKLGKLLTDLHAKGWVMES